MRNRDLVLETITGKAMSIEEIANRTDLDHWVEVACIWLEAGKLTPVHDADNPLEIRWRRDE